MAEVDHASFAEALHNRLQQIGYSLRRAEEQWPQADRAMLSRGVNGKPLSSGNFLLLCELAGLDPYVFLDRAPRRRITMKSLAKQLVTVGVSHETGAE
jgi:hypothetical protein